MKKGNKCFLCFLFLCFGAALVYSDVDYDIETKIFLPPVYYVGDEVELRLKIKGIKENVNIVIPDKLPGENWIEIDKVNYINFSNDIITFYIYFKTFKPGKQLLPYLDLGDIIIEGIEIETQSVIEKMKVQKASPLRGQIDFPGTWLLIFLIVFFAIFIPIASFLSYYYILFISRKIKMRMNKEIPKSKIKKALHLLTHQIKNLDSRQFYIKLADIIREYLEQRFLIPALTLTSRELKLFFENGIQEAGLQAKVYQFSVILSYSDLVKFGHIEATEAEKTDNVRLVCKIVDSIEEEPEYAKP